jgi:hypothetical protein
MNGLKPYNYPRLGPGGSAVLLRGLSNLPYTYAPSCWQTWVIDVPRLRNAQYVADIGGGWNNLLYGKITVAASGFTAGTITVRFQSRDGLDVTVTAAAEVDEGTTAGNIHTAIDDALAGPLGNRVADLSVFSNAVTLLWNDGMHVAITTTFVADVQTFTATFGGTATDGNYDLVFEHESLPMPVTCRVVRTGGSPLTNTNLADAMEAVIEGNPMLAALIDNADNLGAVNTITTFAGVTGLSITASAPAPGTLVVADTSGVTAVAIESWWSLPLDGLPENIMVRDVYAEVTSELVGMANGWEVFLRDVPGVVLVFGGDPSAGLFARSGDMRGQPIRESAAALAMYFASGALPSAGKMVVAINFVPIPEPEGL